jgi:hypothetical protein
VTTTTIQQQLDALAEYQAQRDLLRIAYDEQRAALIPPEVQQALAELDAENRGQIEAVNANIAALGDTIRDAVIAHGATVKGANLQAVYTQGRASWDTKGLDVYAEVRPEILPFRKPGKPFVSFREVK